MKDHPLRRRWQAWWQARQPLTDTLLLTQRNVYILPTRAGIAFADKYRGGDQVTLCSMGDGAVRQGILHETFNMAMTWKLPVIFIIENNNYAMGTSVERTSNVHDLSTSGESYDMPGLGVNGMRCEDVHEAISMACEHVRAGNGPYLLDIKTYRYKGHRA